MILLGICPIKISQYDTKPIIESLFPLVTYLNVSSQNSCWNLNPICDGNRRWVFWRDDWVVRMEFPWIELVCLYGTGGLYTVLLLHERTLRSLKPVTWNRALIDTQTCRHLDQELPDPKLYKIDFCFFSHPSCDTFLYQPELTEVDFYLQFQNI